MKFSLKSAALLAVGAFQLAFAVQNPLDIKTTVVFPNSEDTTKLPEFINGRDVPVQFFFTNNEETPVHIAGYFGSFYYNKKGKMDEAPYANLTTSKVGPLSVESGNNTSFDTKILVNLPPEDFDLVLSFFVGHQNEMVIIKTDPIKVTVVDPPVSFFDPKFLFVQLILGLTVVAIGYFVSNTYLMPYLDTKKTAGPKAAVSEKKRVNVGDKGYDQSWIPSHHLQNASAAKAKKAN